VLVSLFTNKQRVVLWRPRHADRRLAEPVTLNVATATVAHLR